MPRVAVWLVVLTMLAHGAPDHAEMARRLAVVPLDSTSDIAGTAERLSIDIAQAASRLPSTAVMRPREVAHALGKEPLASLQACGGKPECVIQWAASLPADRVVIGSLNRNENSYLLKLFLVDLKSKALLSTVDRAILIASRRLQGDVAAALPAFFEGKAESKGMLSVTTSKPGATVQLDGEVAGSAPLTFEAKPGKHILKVTKDDCLPVERFVTVVEGQTEEIALLLTPIPGMVREAELPALEKKPSETGSSRVPLGTWIAGGVAVAAGGVGIYFAVSAESLHSKAGAGPVYQITRKDAMAGRRDAVVGDICFGVAGAAAVTAAIFAIIRPGSPKAPQAALMPVPGGAAASLSGSF